MFRFRKLDENTLSVTNSVLLSYKLMTFPWGCFCIVFSFRKTASTCSLMFGLDESLDFSHAALISAKWLTR